MEFGLIPGKEFFFLRAQIKYVLTALDNFDEKPHLEVCWLTSIIQLMLIRYIGNNASFRALMSSSKGLNCQIIRDMWFWILVDFRPIITSFLHLREIVGPF